MATQFIVMRDGAQVFGPAAELDCVGWLHGQHSASVDWLCKHEGYAIRPEAGLAAGQRVTLLKIDECLAMSHRFEFEVRSVLEPQAVGYEGRRQRVAVVRQRGKRKDCYLDLAADDILLDGWGLPFRTDTEGGGVMAGNACYNLVGEPEVIRQVIEAKAVVPVTDDAKAKIIVTRTERTTCGDDGLELLYPGIETHHAVVNRMKGA